MAVGQVSGQPLAYLLTRGTFPEERPVAVFSTRELAQGRYVDSAWRDPDVDGVQHGEAMEGRFRRHDLPLAIYPLDYDPGVVPE